MRRALLATAMVCALCACGVRADMCLFDFDSCGAGMQDAGIGAYMTGMYGSPVSAVDVAARSGEGFGDDMYIYADPGWEWWDGDFEINFEAAPISAASFTGHVFYPTAGADFRFRAYSGDTLVYTMTRSEGVESFDTGMCEFSQPVDRLWFSNNFMHCIGIDDLCVYSVPVPASVALGAIALAVLGAVRRRL